jgi:hypothetical protein
MDHAQMGRVHIARQSARQIARQIARHQNRGVSSDARFISR